MGTITGIDDLILRASDGSTGNPQRLFYYRSGQIGGDDGYIARKTSSQPHSLWMYDGVRAGGAIPGAVSAPTNATQGGLLHNNPSGGRQLWMAAHVGQSAHSGMLVVYDRLLHIGGLSGTVTTAQTVGGALTRYTNGIGNIVFAEIYSAVGGSTSTITGAYTNQDGNAATIPTNSSTLIGGSINQEEATLVMLPLASGDTGVQGVTSVTLTNTTGTAGNWGITVAHPIAMIPCQPYSGGCLLNYTDWIPEILTNACIGMFFFGFYDLFQPSSAPTSVGNVLLIEA